MQESRRGPIEPAPAGKAGTSAAYFNTASWNSFQSSRLLRFTASLGAAPSSGRPLAPRVDFRVAGEADTVNDHLIVTCARPGIAGRQFAGGFEGEFEPEPRQVQHAKRTRHAGTDERNNCIHNVSF